MGRTKDFFKDMQDAEIAEIVIKANETVERNDNMPMTGDDMIFYALQNGLLEMGRFLNIYRHVHGIPLKDIEPTFNFWRRLEMFVANVQVNDPASEEEKQMILQICKQKQHGELGPKS